MEGWILHPIIELLGIRNQGLSFSRGHLLKFLLWWILLLDSPIHAFLLAVCWWIWLPQKYISLVWLNLMIVTSVRTLWALIILLFANKSLTHRQPRATRRITVIGLQIAGPILVIIQLLVLLSSCFIRTHFGFDSHLFLTNLQSHARSNPLKWVIHLLLEKLGIAVPQVIYLPWTSRKGRWHFRASIKSSIRS